MDRKIRRDETPDSGKEENEWSRLFGRMEKLNLLLRDFNREGMKEGLPFISPEQLVFYRDIKLFLLDALSPLPIRNELRQELLAFAYRDGSEMKIRHTRIDAYAFTLAYVRQFCYRTGNLDSADDYTIKVDLDLLLLYKDAREKKWAGDALSAGEEALLLEWEEQIVSQVDRVSGCATVS